MVIAMRSQRHAGQACSRSITSRVSVRSGHRLGHPIVAQVLQLARTGERAGDAVRVHQQEAREADRLSGGVTARPEFDKIEPRRMPRADPSPPPVRAPPRSRAVRMLVGGRAVPQRVRRSVNSVRQSAGSTTAGISRRMNGARPAHQHFGSARV
jgi:hypothetical protein